MNTSRAAYNRIKGNVGALQATVLAVLKANPNGLMDDQLIAILGWVPSTVRTRRSELVKMGLVVASGRLGRTKTGCKANIWVAV